MLNLETLQHEEVINKSPEFLKPKEQKLKSQNSLSPKDLKQIETVLGTEVKNMTDEEIRKSFIKMIDDIWLTDEALLKRLKEWIYEAVYEWPKWTILTDWKTITQIIKLIFQLKWKLKDNSYIQIINAFGKTDITL